MKCWGLSKIRNTYVFCLIFLPLSVDAITISGLSVDIDTSLALTIQNSSEEVYIEATSGAITNSVEFTSIVPLHLNAQTNITLDGLFPGNDFIGPVSATAGESVTLVDVNSIDLGEFNVGNDLNITAASGNITDTGAINTAGINLVTTSGNISLNNGLFATSGQFSANTVSLGGITSITIEDFSNANSVFEFNASQTYLDDVLELAFSDPTLLNDGDIINLFGSTGTINYNFSEILLPDLGNGLILGADDLFTNGTLTVSAVPVPAAAWLFGSGLIGLIGIARRKKS